MGKQQIIDFIKDNQIDGNKLIEMKRKKFMIDIAAHLTNKKLTVALGYLYKDLMQFDVKSSLYEDIWSNNKPQSIEECNMTQIIFIAENVISDKVTELKQYTNDIIIYLKQNQFDGNKLTQMKGTEFINQLSLHLNDQKLKGKLGKLRKNMLAFDLTKYEDEDEELKEQSDEIPDNLKKSNGKFVTEIKEEKKNDS